MFVEWLSLAEACRRSGWSLHQIRIAVRENQVEHITTPSGRVRISSVDLVRLVADAISPAREPEEIGVKP